MGVPTNLRSRSRARAVACLAALSASAALHAQPAATPAPTEPAGRLPGVNVTYSSLKDPVEKSYRKMVRAMDLFEREHARSPQGQLRFRLLPRKPGVDLDRLEMLVLGRNVELPVAIAADRTFTLPRDARAFDEDAIVSPDRKALTMTWRAEVRTPGLPAGTRRLGDLRLECRVGMEAGLFSNSPNFLTRMFDAISTTPGYCDSADNRYLFFADRPVFGVTLVDGARRETLPADRLYAAAIGDPDFARELPYCDCEMLLDRTYYLPLGDRRWPDDTLVVFDFMEPANAAR